MYLAVALRPCQPWHHPWVLAQPVGLAAATAAAAIAAAAVAAAAAAEEQSQLERPAQGRDIAGAQLAAAAAAGVVVVAAAAAAGTVPDC